MSSGPLIDFRPHHRFFIGVDSDGCAFDSMTIKHRLAFIPAAVATWNLQAVESAFTAAEEYVNLYSAHRGINRFAGLLLSFERLRDEVDVTEYGVALPDLEVLRAFVKSGLTQSNAGLREFVKRQPSRTASELLAWSEAADAAFERHARGQPPFAGVREALARASKVADIMVVSAASSEGLSKDWEAGGLLPFVRVVAGQEFGSKREQLRAATVGRYAVEHMLMVGDAEGDLQAARAVGAQFFPIQPRRETESWQRFHDEILDRFVAGTYVGRCEADAIAAFQRSLSTPPPSTVTRPA